MSTAAEQKKTSGPLERLGVYRVFPLHRLPLSLGMKILLVLMAMLVIGFVVTLRLSLALIYDNIWRQTQNKLENDSKLARLVYESKLHDVETTVDFTSNRFFLIEEIKQKNFDSLQVELARVRKDRGLDLLGLTDPKGVVLFRTSHPYRSGDSLVNCPVVARALKGQKASGTVLIDSTRLALESEEMLIRGHVAAKPTEHSNPGPPDEVTSAMVLMAAYPVRDGEGNIIGALYGGRMLNNDHELVDDIKRRIFPDTPDGGGNHSMASIFFWDIRVATTVTLDNGNRAVGSRMYSEVKDAVLVNGHDWKGTSFVVHDWYFASYEPIRSPDGKVAGAIGIGIWKAPFIALRDDFILRFVQVSAVGVVIALVFGLLFSRMLTKPLRELVKASGELARGNLDYRVRIKSGRDEIRDLEVAFNGMAQELNRAMNEKNELAEQMKDLNERYMELLGFASHEVKQPIGVIAATISNMRRNSFPSHEKMDNILDRLERNVAHLSSMSEKYLFYSKIESGQLQIYPRECQLYKEVIDPALDGDQKSILDRNMRVEWENKSRLAKLMLYVDPEMMRVVFSNLISNATKYGYQDGYIKIVFQEIEGGYRFEVKNSGEGIPPDKREVIFEKFQRLESVRLKQKGTGLGLFNARKIVELHGGKIWAESEPGKWANTIFTLPMERVNIAAAKPPEKGYQEDELWGY